MLKSSSRRLVSLAAVASIAALALLGQAPAGSAASGSTLFGVTRSQQLLVRIDPTTGSLTQVTSLFPNCSGNCPLDSQSSELASDPTTHRLFALRTNSFSFDFPPVFTQELLTIDSQSGAILSNPLFAANAPQALAFDTSSHRLFGFTGSAIVTVDPATASMTPFASVGAGNGAFIDQMALSSSTGTIYISQESLFLPPSPTPTQIFSVNSTTGAVAPPVTVDTPVRWITTDGGTLFGLTDTSSPSLVRIDPATGVTTAIGFTPFFGGFIPTAPVTDPTTHTVYVDVSVFNGFQFADQLVSINDQSGATTTTPLLTFDNLTTMVVEAAPPVTPESIKADVQAALANGGIDNAGVAASLLSKLDAAARARAGASASPTRTNACATSAMIYQSFINDVVAQSGGAASGVRGHISAATASQLISEAQFLIANCP